MTLLGSSTLLFSDCISSVDSFGHERSFQDVNHHSHNRCFSSYYPTDTYKSYYFLDGKYYYGGYYKHGFYYYKGRRFSRGHYYRHGYRYYHGKRYKAIRGRYGYHVSRRAHRHDRHPFKKHRPYIKKRQHVHHVRHPRDHGYKDERYSSKHRDQLRGRW